MAQTDATPELRKKRRFFYLGNGFDMPFFIMLTIVIIIGLATLYSASHVYAFNYNDGDSYFYIRKQLIFVAIGMVGMFGVSMVDYHILRKLAVPIWIFSILLLIVALVMPSASGINRWIRLPGLGQFQPSELAKFALVLIFAQYISINYKRMKQARYGFWPLAVILGITCVLVLIEPHLSGTLLIGLLGFALMFIGGTGIGWLLGTAGAGVAGVYVLTAFLGYEKDRIAVWHDPLGIYSHLEMIEEFGRTGRDLAWQTVQSLYAIGSGGLLGQGPGNSRQKHLFLPEPQNDFIFSVYCEEMGFIGAVVLIVLFGLLVWRGLRIGLHAPDKFGSLLAIGLTLQIGLQVAINVAVVSNLMPNTGISLPFFSYGGTSILMLMLQMGVVLSISRQMHGEKE